MEFRLPLISALIFGLFLAGLLTQRGESVVLAIPFLIYLAYAWLARPGVLNLELTRKLGRDRTRQETEVGIELSVTNLGHKLEGVLIQDHLPAGLELVDGEHSLFSSLAAGQSASLMYRVRGQRGHYQWAGVRVLVTDPFAMIRKTTFSAISSGLSILPDVHRLKKIELRPRTTRIYSGNIPARIGGPGVEFHNIRPYQPGDPLRWINARASARQPEGFFINQYVQERVADVGLVLDARSLSNLAGPEGSLLEHSINAAASLSVFLLDSGNRVGLLIYGGPIRWTFPGYGRIQKERILQALAGAELGFSPIFEDLAYIPTRLFPANSQLIVLSPLLEEDLAVLARLRARGYSLAVVSPDPIEFEGKQLGKDPHVESAKQIARVERRFLLKRLRQAGIVVADWDLGRPFYHVAHQVLRHSQALGRVSAAGLP